MATHSSILARRIPWTEDSRQLQSIVDCFKESDTTETTGHTHTLFKKACLSIPCKYSFQ